MRFISFFRKKKRDSTAVTKYTGPHPCFRMAKPPELDPSLLWRKPLVPASGPGVVVREDYFTYRDHSAEDDEEETTDLPRSTSLTNLVETVHERGRQRSRSFADLRSFTDEYI